MSKVEFEFPALNEDETMQLFDLAAWEAAVDPGAARATETPYLGTLDRPRKRAAAFLPEILGQQEQTEQINPKIRFFPESYPVGTIFDFSVSYLKRTSRPSPAGEISRQLVPAAKPDLLVARDYASAIQQSVQANLRMIETFKGWQTAESIYTSYRWQAILLEDIYSNKILMGLTDDGSNSVRRVFFPQHDPAKVGMATKVSSVSGQERTDEYEHIDWIDVFQYPELWELALKAKTPSTLGKLVTNLKAQLARPN